MLATCNDKQDIKFVDVTPIFHLADVSINDSYIMQNGVLRTRNAMNKMAVKLDLQTKNPKEGVCNSNQAKFPSPKTCRAIIVDKSCRTWTCGLFCDFSDIQVVVNNYINLSHGYLHHNCSNRNLTVCSYKKS